MSECILIKTRDTRISGKISVIDLFDDTRTSGKIYVIDLSDATRISGKIYVTDDTRISGKISVIDCLTADEFRKNGLENMPRWRIFEQI